MVVNKMSPSQSGNAAQRLFLVVNNLTATIVAVGANVVSTMDLAAGGFHRQGRTLEAVVGSAHASFGRRLAILLYSHVNSSSKFCLLNLPVYRSSAWRVRQTDCLPCPAPCHHLRITLYCRFPPDASESLALPVLIHLPPVRQVKYGDQTI